MWIGYLEVNRRSLWTQKKVNVQNKELSLLPEQGYDRPTSRLADHTHCLYVMISGFCILISKKKFPHAFQ